MRTLWNRCFPTMLKNRLFASYILLILLPFAILNIYLFQNIELIIQKKIAERSHDQLIQMSQSLEDVMSVAFKTLLLLEQDKEIQRILREPASPQSFEHKYQMEEKFRNITNSLFITVPQVYFTIIDFQGNVYASFMPKEKLSYEKITKEAWYTELIQGNLTRRWVDNEVSYVSRDLSPSPYLISLYAKLADEFFDPYGVARISLDYSNWLDGMVRSNPVDQHYYLVSEDGELLGESGSLELTQSTLRNVIKMDKSGFFVDEQNEKMVNYHKIESIDWYMVSQIPLNVLYKEVNVLKNQFFIIFVLITAVFIIITFIISKTITRPLYQLQSKMKNAISKSFMVNLPEEKYTGEILELTKTFNKMAVDMNALIQELKQEQRQREAIHFQMLLSQLNPHFLLNTLNIIKWLSLRKEQTEIAEVCVALGSLLETSLNSDKELIPLYEEISLIEAFMHIHKYKHNQKINIRYEYSDQLKFALVPKLSLQPIVENAVKYAFAEIEHDAEICIEVLRVPGDGQKLCLRVVDNGIGIEKARLLMNEQRQRRSTGIGLKNIQERLKLIYKSEGQFQIESSANGTIVEMILPLLISEPYLERGIQHVDNPFS